MDSYGFLWIHMDSYGFLWIPEGFLWIPMDSYVFLCIPMYSYGFTCNPVFVFTHAHSSVQTRIFSLKTPQGMLRNIRVLGQGLRFPLCFVIYNTVVILYISNRGHGRRFLGC
jgi:hypothetical protein